MQRILIGSLLVSAVLLAACDESSSGSQPAAAPSAAPSAKASASAAAEAPKPPEGPKDHAARAKALAEAFTAHDAKRFAALYAENAVIKTCGQPDLTGRAAIEKDTEHMFAVFEDVKLVAGRIWAKDKHTAVLEWVDTGTNTGDAPEMGLPKATNKPVGVVGASWLEVGDDGFITAEHVYVDTPTMIGQLKPDPKNPVRAVVTAPPNGTSLLDAQATPGVSGNVEILSKWATTFSAGKIDEALKVFGKDVVMDDYSSPAAIKGEKPIKDMWTMYVKALPDLKPTLARSFATGDYVVGEWEYQGINKGPMGPIKATNKPIDLHEVEVDQLKDGKVINVWAWGNSAEMLGQMGLLPPPGPAAPAPSAKPAPAPAAK
jgi:ketosteroid isomerase-like protein